MRKLYDFSDWEPSEPSEPSNLAEWVRDNLREAFKQFGNGYWILHSGSTPALEWAARDWDTDPISICFGPDELKERLIEEIDDQFPSDGSPRSDEQREGVRDVLSIISAWRAALDAAEARANEMLSRPIA